MLMLQRLVVTRAAATNARHSVRRIASVTVTRDDGLPELIITPLAAKVRSPRPEQHGAMRLELTVCGGGRCRNWWRRRRSSRSRS